VVVIVSLRRVQEFVLMGCLGLLLAKTHEHFCEVRTSLTVKLCVVTDSSNVIDESREEGYSQCDEILKTDLNAHDA